MNKQDLIKELEEQLKVIKPENMEEASWGYEKGVILSGNEAKAILKLLKK